MCCSHWLSATRALSPPVSLSPVRQQQQIAMTSPPPRPGWSSSRPASAVVLVPSPQNPQSVPLWICKCLNSQKRTPPSRLHAMPCRVSTATPNRQALEGPHAAVSGSPAHPALTEAPRIAASGRNSTKLCPFEVIGGLLSHRFGRLAYHSKGADLGNPGHMQPERAHQTDAEYPADLCHHDKPLLSPM